MLALGLVCAPVVTGALVMWLGGAPSTRWAGHLVAGAVGLCVYAANTRAPRCSHKVGAAAAIAGLIVVACTLAAPGLQGVHRWLVVPGIRLHASQLVMPALLVFMATRLRRSPTLAQALLLASQAIHLLQPDAGQATSVAAASLVVFLGGPSSRLSRACAVASVAIAAATWMRLDPLAPSPFVEDIFRRAFAISWPVGCLGLLSLAAATLAPATLPDQPTAPDTALARRGLAVYFATAAVVTVFGHFPVPLLGYGTSSVLGTFLGIASITRR